MAHHSRILDIPLHDRPRERLERLGSEALTDRELLAVVLGAGSGSRSALDVADGLSTRFGGISQRLARASPATLRQVHGVGRVSAARLAAALELGRRLLRAEGEADRIRGPRDVHRRMGPLLSRLAHEEFHALLLTSQHQVIRTLQITRGTLDASLIHPRELFREAVAEAAAAIILVHNHPSGDPTPSPQDRAVTRQMVEAGQTLGIPVIDHVIIGNGRYRSLMGARGGGIGRVSSAMPPRGQPFETR
jgi:DNA repair protein RadC